MVPSGSDISVWASSWFNSASGEPGIPFGLANEALDVTNAGGHGGSRHEDHVGHKIEWANDVELKRALTGEPLGVTCDYLVKIHQGTHSADALAARVDVESGATLWRIGTMGRSAAGEAQFWALEHPLTSGFAARHGIPARNILNADFIEAAILKPGTPFVTRGAPGVGTNLGGAIEVVVPEGGVALRGFSYYGPKGAL